MEKRYFLSVLFAIAASPAGACQISSNLVINCGFDVDLAHWTAIAGSCDHDELAGAAEPGSARCASESIGPAAHVMRIRQCALDALPGIYALGAYARRDSGDGVECSVGVETHALADCADASPIDATALIPAAETFAVSTPKSVLLQAASSAVSVDVVCFSAAPFSVLLDDVLFGADLIFANGFDFVPPVLTAGAILSYTENQAATAIDTSITVNDADSVNLASATASITANFQSGQDVLACGSCGALVPVYTPGTGVLTLTGSATPAAYQTALRSVTYANTSENPSTLARTITWVASDGSLSSTPVTSTVTVASVNDLPVLTAGATMAYTENDPAKVIDATITVADADNTSVASATVSITSNFQTAEDILACGACGAIVPVYTPGTGILTLTGSATLAAYQAALRTVTYRNSSDNPSAAPRTITWVANDGTANSLAVTSTVNITAVNDAPVGVVPAGSPFAISGNIRRGIAAGTLLAGATDAENNGPLTTQLFGVPTNNATVVVNTDGSFTYNPGAGYDGSATFQFVVCDAAPLCGNAVTVGVTITGMIWFVDDSAGAGSGRLTDPMNSIATFSAINNGTGNNPAANDSIFLYNGTYTGPLTLLTNQRLLGEGMSITLSAATGITPPAGSDALPTTTLANRPAWTSSGTTLTLGSGNVLRGFNIGNSTTAKLSGTSFGTLTVNEIALSGTGKALNLTTGAFSGSSAFDSIATTSSSTQGLSLSGITGGTLTIGGTTVSGSATQGILVGTTQANIAFGNTNIPQSGGPGVDLSANSGAVTFADLDIVPDAGQRALLALNNTGTITSTSGTISAGTATAVQITGVSTAMRTPLAMVLDSVSSTGGANNIALANVSGSLVMNAGALSGALGTSFAVGTAAAGTGGTATITFTGSITQNAAQRVVDIQNTTAGSVTIATLTGGTLSTGVNINAANGNVAFTNLTLGTSGARINNQAVTITNGTGTYNLGTVSIFTNNVPGIVSTNADGTLNSTTGTVDAGNNSAINIDGPAGLTTLGMTLVRVDSDDAAGSAAGIVLQDTNGSFIVNGDGANTAVGGNSSGGVISGKSGADGATSGNGVFLTNASGVTLRRMTINGINQNHGIRGVNSSNFTLEYSTVSGTNGNNVGIDEGSVNFDNLTGAAAITSCVIDGGLEDNLNVVNTAGTLNRLTITGTTFGLNNIVNGNNNILIESQNAGTTLNFTLQSSIVKGARADWINASNNSSSTMDAVVGGSTPALGNTFDNLGANAHPGAAAGGNRVVFGAVGVQTVDIRNNSMRGSKGEAIRLRSTASGVLTGTLDARVRNNTIGVAGTANSGSSEASGVFVFVDGGGDADVAITNNQIFQYNNHGINLQNGDEINDGSVFNATVTGNTINTPGNINSEFNGIHLNNGTVGATDNFTSCVDIGGAGLQNNIVGSGNGVVSPNNQQFRLRQRQSTTVRLPGYAGANNNDAAVVIYLQGRNTVTAGNGAASNTVPTGGGFIGGATCTQPSFP